jgi:hypothetical protein
MQIHEPPPGFIEKEIKRDAQFWFRLITSGEMTLAEEEAELRVSPRQRLLLEKMFWFSSYDFRAAVFVRERTWNQLKRLLAEHQQKIASAQEPASGSGNGVPKSSVFGGRATARINLTSSMRCGD